MLRRPQDFFKKHDQQAPASTPLSTPSSSSPSSLSSEIKTNKEEKPTRQDQMARLPAAVFQNILAPMLEMNEVKNLSHASKTQLFFCSNPDLRKRMKAHRQIRQQEDKIFTHLARGEQKEVQAMLDKALTQGSQALIKLLTMQHIVIDHAERRFINITLFQLALWYLDRHMWQMLLTYFKDQTVREALRGEAYRQYQEHQSGQTQYAKEHGQYYQFEGKEPGQEGLVTELQAYRDLVGDPETMRSIPTNGAQATRARQKMQSGVGGAQARSPLHVIQEYCRQDGPNFGYPLPETRFKEGHLPRTVRFYSWITGTPMTFWEGLTSGLGSTFGLLRSSVASAGYVRLGPPHEDLAACRRLCQVRMKEYQALEPQLKKDLEAVVDPSLVILNKTSKAEKPTRQDQMARLPAAIFQNILAPMLEMNEIQNLSHASKTQLFFCSNADLRKRMNAHRQIRQQEDKIFTHLARGEQKEVQAMLDKALTQGNQVLIKLLTMQHIVIDHAERRFINITLFQLALWYLDRHMWQMLLTYFKDQTVREALRGEAYRQYQEHQSGQTQYAKEHGQYYQFEGKEPGQEGLVTELQAYHDLLAAPEFKWGDEGQGDRASKKWQSGVGGAQARSPLHVIQEYCRKDGPNFDNPLPETRFKEEHLPRTVYFYNWRTNTGMTFWEGLTSGLGSIFGIFTSRWGTGAGWESIRQAEDLAACRRLSQVRMKEYHALELKLKKDLKAVVDPSTEAITTVESSLRLSR